MLRAALLVCLALAAPAVPALPQHLRDTGLDALETVPFSPQYPLWSDGSTKRRWLHLPPGTAIDASRPDAWAFTPGTRAWKEFSYNGQRIETRFIERLADGTWRFATYLWNQQGTDAVLAPAKGVPELAIPSRSDCLACHEGAAVPVLGFSALQLAAELPSLAARGYLRNLPAPLLASPPSIAAPNATARAALGYLHGNCGHCHNASGPLAEVGLHLAQPAAIRLPADPALLIAKMRARNPLMRMPPLGVSVPDAEGIALVTRWIQDLPTPPEPSP